jgi:hypothetical protein
VAAATPAHRELARWLLAREMDDPRAPTDPAGAAEAACRKLSHRVARLVTVVACQALMGRALHLARRDFPFLEGVRPGPSPDVCLEGLAECVRGVEPARATEGLATVLANVLGLLATFVGDEITLRLVRDAWPDARLGGADAGTEGAGP